ncbi:MAG: 5'/3'-nucleotidase SurE [Desulfobacteraceae bacterium]|nr:MAG: 5'/3'-nucleotidase SurE [Desulfobacteraceae bacterium]
MRLLLTNDDGIHAPGLRALVMELKPDFEIHVVAPDAEMSAVGHGVSLAYPLRVQAVQKQGTLFGHSISGTPADCVKIAVQELMKEPPDLILSGINPGANVGVNVLYSGTVSAATEGAFLGIPSIALSLNARHNPDFTFAARFSRKIINYIKAQDLRTGTALNVNVPALPPEQIRGVVITKQSLGRFRDRYERRVDPRGHAYYWLAGEQPHEDRALDSDVRALNEHKISITPISFDLTCREEFERLKRSDLPDL